MKDIKTEAKQTIETLCTKILQQGYTVDFMLEKQYNYELTVSNSEAALKVLTYFGKNGVKTILQGNQQTGIYNSISDIINEQIQLRFNMNTKLDKFSNYIGSDESGKGDLFGPLVVVAFYFDESIEKDLIRLKIRDSKEINLKEINSIAKILLDKFSDRIEKKILTPSEYNLIYPKYRNLNKLLADIHGYLIIKLQEKFKCNNAIIDKFTKAQRFDKIVSETQINLMLIEKAEKFHGVGAASIIARYFFTQWFNGNKINNKEIPKGSSIQAINFAKNLIKEINPIELTKFAKLHFKTFRQ